MPYKCRTCNKYFSTSSNRLRHEKSMHIGAESDGQDDSDEEESIDYEVEDDGDGDSDGGGAEDDDEAEDFEWAKWKDFVDQSIKDLDEPINTAYDLLEDATFSQFCENLRQNVTRALDIADYMKNEDTVYAEIQKTARNLKKRNHLLQSEALEKAWKKRKYLIKDYIREEKDNIEELLAGDQDESGESDIGEEVEDEDERDDEEDEDEEQEYEDQ